MLKCYLAIIILIGAISCTAKKKQDSDKYKYSVVVNAQQYAIDSIYLCGVLNEMLSKNINPFSPKGYYVNATSVYLDSILYGPDKLRNVVFVISKVPLKNGSYDFNANYLFASRDSASAAIKVYVYSPFNIGNYKSYNEVKESLHDLCFERRMTDHWWNGKQPRYNINDVRFWSSDEFNSIMSNQTFVQKDLR